MIAYIKKFSKAVTDLENVKSETIAEVRHSSGAQSVLASEIENIEHVLASLKRELARLLAINDKNPALAGAGFQR